MFYLGLRCFTFEHLFISENISKSNIPVVCLLDEFNKYLHRKNMKQKDTKKIINRNYSLICTIKNACHFHVNNARLDFMITITQQIRKIVTIIYIIFRI